MPSNSQEWAGSPPNGAPPISSVTCRDPARPPGVRVLLVEDLVKTALMLEEILELYGHEVEVAFSGLEGVAKAGAMRPDIIICDLGLPDVDGCVVAETLRADPVFRAVPLVALSGQCLPEDVERAKRAGFDRHVAKPPQIEPLNTLIWELTSRGAAAPPGPASSM